MYINKNENILILIFISISVTYFSRLLIIHAMPQHFFFLRHSYVLAFVGFEDYTAHLEIFEAHLCSSTHPRRNIDLGITCIKSFNNTWIFSYDSLSTTNWCFIDWLSDEPLIYFLQGFLKVNNDFYRRFCDLCGFKLHITFRPREWSHFVCLAFRGFKKVS